LSTSSVNGTATISASARAVYAGNASIVVNATTGAIGYVYGEEWVNVVPQDNTWTQNTVSNDTWADKAVGSEVWSDIEGFDPSQQYVLNGYWEYGYSDRDIFVGDLWTDKNIGTNTWLNQ
jgi:hypothetical protein